MLQELSTCSSQAFFLAWILPFSSPSTWILHLGGLEGLERVTDELGDTISALEQLKEPLRRAEVQDGDAAVPQHSGHTARPTSLASTCRSIRFPPPPRFCGLTDYIYHTCSSQGNGLNFIQYTPSGSAFKTHPRAHFSLSPRTPAAISHLYSGNKS